MIDDDRTGLDEVQEPFYEQPTLEDFAPLPGMAPRVWPPPPRTNLAPQGLSTGMVILLVVLAVVLIGGGLGFTIYSATAQYHKQLTTQATSQVQSTIQAQNTALSKTQVVLQATNQALATAQAGILATATAQAGATATATAAGNLGTATATALENLLANDTSGNPALMDSLSDNTHGNQWDEGLVGNGNTGCFFNQDYHVREAQVNFLQPCFADTTNFSNFVYEVQMTIDHGSQGGILFRADKSMGQYYLFRVGTNSSYTLEVYKNNKSVMTLSSGISSAISTGDGQSNQMAVIAKNNSLYLYVNQQLVTSVVDSTLSAGQIGVAAVDYSTPTEAEFSNVQVWKL